MIDKRTVYEEDVIKAITYGALSSATLFGRSDAGMTALRETVRAIEQLPSAQPKSSESKRDLSDTISRRKAIEWVENILEVGMYYHPHAKSRNVPIDEVIDRLKRVPSEQPQRTKGRWERKESDLSWWYECSECGESPLFDPYENEVRSPFCPWCGAEMEMEGGRG